MAFHTADYDTYIVLGDPAVDPLWHWKVWRKFLPAIDLLIQAARGTAAVRSTQYLPNRAGTVKFGRLGWKESDHQKWSHGSPANEEASKLWRFLSLEVWAPGWTVCGRENLAPDVYLSIVDESLGGGYGRELLFNPVVVFAAKSAFERQPPSAVAKVVSTLRELTTAKLVGYKRRPWGYAFGAVGFTRSIQDLAVTGLFKPGPRHTGELGFHLFANKWELVSADGTVP